MEQRRNGTVVMDNPRGAGLAIPVLRNVAESRVAYAETNYDRLVLERLGFEFVVYNRVGVALMVRKDEENG